MDNFWSFSEHELGASGVLRSNISFNYFNYLLAVFKEDFKKHKMNTWWIGHIFGVSGLLFSFLDIFSMQDMFNSMPTEFKWSIELFSLVYVFFQSLRAYERYRKEKHENDKQIFLWKIEKDKLVKPKATK